MLKQDMIYFLYLIVGYSVIVAIAIYVFMGSDSK